MFLRGTNANACVDDNPSRPETMPICAPSPSERAVLGFDVVRLPLSLSLLEPEPGRIAQSYLDRGAPMVAEARATGLWVLLDLHQGRYRPDRFDGEADGIATWAVGRPACPEHRSSSA